MADLDQLVHPSWVPILRPYAAQIDRIDSWLLANCPDFVPRGDRVFRAFSRPFLDTRVLLLGQDPYPTPGHAVGLSFSVDPTVQPLPGSLRNIFTELHDDLGCPIPTNGDLSPWFEQGVLLLNTHLTTAPGQPAAHARLGCDQVTGHVVNELARTHTATPTPLPLVGLLWGSHARGFAPALRGGRVPVVESAHPSPLSAYRGFFGSRPFSRVNQLLIEQGADPINWSLA